MPITLRKLSEDKDEKTLAFPDHALKTPHVLKMSRSATATQQRITIKVVQSDVDAAGEPRAQNTIGELVLRMPVANNSAHFAASLTALRDVLSHATVSADLLGGYLPSGDTLTI